MRILNKDEQLITFLHFLQNEIDLVASSIGMNDFLYVTNVLLKNMSLLEEMHKHEDMTKKLLRAYYLKHIPQKFTLNYAFELITPLQLKTDLCFKTVVKFVQIVFVDDKDFKTELIRKYEIFSSSRSVSNREDYFKKNCERYQLL